MMGKEVLILPAFLTALSQRAEDKEFSALWRQRADIRPFILEPMETNVLAITTDQSVVATSLPFPVCYFEYLGELALLKRFSESGVERLTIFAGVFAESSGPHLEGWFMADSPSVGIMFFYLNSNHPDWETLSLNSLLERLLGQVRSKKIGTEKCNLKAKARTRSGTEFVKIKKLIRVTGASGPEAATTSIGYEIDWTHRWEVMGHWRRVAGLGKNRAGEYVVHGLTWVSPHSKGPEHLPLVAKSRLVTGGVHQ